MVFPSLSLCESSASRSHINIKEQPFLNTYPYSLLVTSWVNCTQELKPHNQGRPQVTTRRKLLDLQKWQLSSCRQETRALGPVGFSSTQCNSSCVSFGQGRLEQGLSPNLSWICHLDHFSACEFSGKTVI